MKRLMLATTSLVVAGGMAAAEVSVSGSAELGISGEKGKDAKLHKDIDVNFSMSGETDGGLSFGASIDLDEAQDSDTYDKNGHVHMSGVFGTVTLGDTDGGYDAALSEVAVGSSLTDNHTTHPGYNGNSGLDGAADLANNSGNILRYDYSFGGVTTSASAEINGNDSSLSTYGLGVAWSGDVGGIGMGLGLGYQSGKGPTSKVSALGAATTAGDADTRPNLKADGTTTTTATEYAMADSDVKASVIGLSASADMGNGFSVTVNGSRTTHEVEVSGIDNATGDVKTTTTHVGLGIGYTTGDLTIGVNGGSSTEKDENDTNVAKADVKKSGAGVAVTYSLGTGASLQLGVGSGKDGDDKKSSWSAGLAFSF